MTLEDPFFVVKDEVCKALNKTRGLYGRWTDSQLNVTVATPNGVGPGGLPVSKEELEWTTTELRNALQKNPTKFKIDNKELSFRRAFIDHTRDEVKIMKDKMNLSRGRDRDRTARQPLLDNNSPARAPINHGKTKYSKLENEVDSPSRQFLDDTLQQQGQMLRQQDEQLDMIGESIGTLKTVSRQINSELDEQAVMLDDFGNELEATDSKLDATMKKMAKVLHMSNGNYNNYIPAPTTSNVSNDSVYQSKTSSSLSTISTTITNCFMCSAE
ncbi:hypothetical protein PV327_003353 [Microctonus hyperodae]|uniref:t-SNARE coiled-coil homology domain-containing protein n=1 Tax=Microctonus hyperodae TaxID=165561 RepID=A0AA39L137_MICHY|nr:hypothetical protein PV327_003353 [Microctonus hyperodae]